MQIKLQYYNILFKETIMKVVHTLKRITSKG